MSAIEIKHVTSKKDLNTFLKFPWEIYKDDPYWVPPLLMEKKEILDKKKNPFFNNAEIDLYMAYKDGELAGRIAAIKNDMHNKVHNENVGFFGFFECINDQEVANKLLDTAREWLKVKGLDVMRGPASPSSNDEWMLLIDGFEDEPRLMMPYNPRYYMDLLDNYGLKKAKDMYAWKLERDKVLSSEKLKRIAELAKKRSGVTVRQLNMKDFTNELERFKEVYNKAWEPNWGFVPLTDEEIDAFAKNLKPLVEPEIVLFMEKEGETIGAALCMLDYNAIFKEMDGKLFPFNFLKLFTQKKKIKYARIITLGIIPEHQKKGLDAVLYYEIVTRANEIGITNGEASWVLEDNDMMNRGAKVMNAEIYKTYRVYETEI